MVNDSSSSGNFKKIPVSAGTEASGDSDADGQKEAAALGAGTLEEQTLALTQSLRRHVNISILVLVWLSVCLIAAALIIAAVNHLTPWGWLTELQLAVLDTFLFSGALVSTVGRYIATRVF